VSGTSKRLSPQDLRFLYIRETPSDEDARRGADAVQLRRPTSRRPPVYLRQISRTTATLTWPPCKLPCFLIS